ncbi:MAG: hypothetical protein Q8942_02285 [Bacillota bacterium]|nr:hypothetical protein [Bacillota bacterium]
MKLVGKLVRDNRIIRAEDISEEDTGLPYRDRLETCFVKLCKKLDIPVPMWLKKNTKEFVSFRTTFFSKEQFVENVNFDRFEMKLE